MKWTKATTFSHRRAHIRYATHAELPANPIMWIQYEKRNSPTQPWKAEQDEYIITNTKKQFQCSSEGEIPAMIKAFKSKHP